MFDIQKNPNDFLMCFLIAGPAGSPGQIGQTGMMGPRGMRGEVRF